MAQEHELDPTQGLGHNLLILQFGVNGGNGPAIVIACHCVSHGHLK